MNMKLGGALALLMAAGGEVAVPGEWACYGVRIFRIAK